MIHTLAMGERCQTPQGEGVVNYWRYAPPDYRTIASVSVRLDSQMPRFIPYQGTVFPATDVRVQREGAWRPVATKGEA